MMEDAEAEAVLLVLADPLQWKPFELDKQNCFFAQAGLAKYAYGPMPDEPLFLVAYTSDVVEVADMCHQYSTLAAAKAACERHHATGKWE